MDMAVFSPFIQVRIYFGYGHTFISTLGIEELRNLLFNKLIFQSADSSTRLLTHWIIDNSIDKHNNRSAVPKISILNALFAGLTIKSVATREVADNYREKSVGCWLFLCGQIRP